MQLALLRTNAKRGVPKRLLAQPASTRIATRRTLAIDFLEASSSCRGMQQERARTLCMSVCNSAP
eukprot:4399213-Amphidinium_carterae.2